MNAPYKQHCARTDEHTPHVERVPSAGGGIQQLLCDGEALAVSGVQVEWEQPVDRVAELCALIRAGKIDDQLDDIQSAISERRLGELKKAVEGLREIFGKSKRT